MKPKELDDVLFCLGTERRVFHYFKDRYCFDLIALEMQRLGVTDMTVAALKRSAVGRYLNKPSVAAALGQCGDGIVRRDQLPLLWPCDQLPFTVTLGRWGDGGRRWDQTSRRQANLVLQINFDGGHRRCYERMIKPTLDYGPFEMWCHPVVTEGRKTLAWVRLDIDFDTNEVLIEEIQNDWLRNASEILRDVRAERLRQPGAKPVDVCYEIEGSYEDLAHYVETVLQPYRAVWAEAAMLAALRFVIDELGLGTLYYHTFETGRKLKRVGGKPPKSLYTALPKDFGFELTHERPTMLARCKAACRSLNAIANPAWFRMAL